VPPAGLGDSYAMANMTRGNERKLVDLITQRDMQQNTWEDGRQGRWVSELLMTSSKLRSSGLLVNECVQTVYTTGLISAQTMCRFVRMWLYAVGSIIPAIPINMIHTVTVKKKIRTFRLLRISS
jgi:hypothetical protein